MFPACMACWPCSLRNLSSFANPFFVSCQVGNRALCTNLPKSFPLNIIWFNISLKVSLKFRVFIKSNPSNSLEVSDRG